MGDRLPLHDDLSTYPVDRSDGCFPAALFAGCRPGRATGLGTDAALCPGAARPDGRPGDGDRYLSADTHRAAGRSLASSDTFMGLSYHLEDVKATGRGYLIETSIRWEEGLYADYGVGTGAEVSLTDANGQKISLSRGEVRVPRCLLSRALVCKDTA